MISPDGLRMIVVQPGPEDRSDLYQSCRQGDSWGAPVRLEGVNSPFADFAPAFDPAETYLYFTSERPGIAGPVPAGTRPPGDIYRIPLIGLLPDCGG
jgi:hypothetical protein